jgi:hypothetical protein
MQAVNLIPASRRDAKRCRRRVRQCIAICLLYAMVSSALACAWRWSVSGADLGIEQQLGTASADIDRASNSLTFTNTQLSAARSQIASNRQILSQPDWSLLLALLGKETGGAIVLRSLELKPGDAPVGATTPAAPKLTLRLSGFGRTNQAVAEFGLRLEETHLFSRVTLVDSSRDTFLAGDAFSFHLECPLDEQR